VPALLAVACASVHVEPIGPGYKKSSADEDEKKLWEASADLARALERARLLYHQSSLESYLNEVAGKLWRITGLPSELSAKVRVIKHPFLNAFTTPDGQIYFHSGLLARLENEAQFAVILGHEFTHYIKRHTLKEERLLEQRISLIKVLQVLAMTAGAVGGPGLAALAGDAGGRAGALWTLASVSGYSQEHETEADTEGFRFLVAGGYDVDEAPKVFEHLRRRLDSHVEQPFFFATHPKLEQRMDNYRRLAQAEKKSRPLAASGVANTDGYMEAIRQLQLENIEMDLEIGRLETAKWVLDIHLGRWPASARGHFLLGSYYRKSSGSAGDHRAQATAAYREALRLDPEFAEASRELGLIHRARDEIKPALEALRRYLALRPEATDAPIIRGYLSELEKRAEH
jgi:Zn-dependent protease with chaperone function